MEAICDEEELEILESLDEKDSFQKPTREQVNHYKESALLTKAQNMKKQTTIRFNVADLVSVKTKAKELGIGYQNIIQALVHNYAQGKIKLEL